MQMIKNPIKAKTESFSKKTFSFVYNTTKQKLQTSQMEIQDPES